MSLDLERPTKRSRNQLVFTKEFAFLTQAEEKRLKGSKGPEALDQKIKDSKDLLQSIINENGDSYALSEEKCTDRKRKAISLTVETVETRRKAEAAVKRHEKAKDSLRKIKGYILEPPIPVPKEEATLIREFVERIPGRSMMYGRARKGSLALIGHGVDCTDRPYHTYKGGDTTLSVLFRIVEDINDFPPDTVGFYIEPYQSKDMPVAVLVESILYSRSSRDIVESVRRCISEFYGNPREALSKTGNVITACCICGRSIKQEKTLNRGVGESCQMSVDQFLSTRRPGQ